MFQEGYGTESDKCKTVKTLSSERFYEIYGTKTDKCGTVKSLLEERYGAAPFNCSLQQYMASLSDQGH